MRRGLSRLLLLVLVVASALAAPAGAADDAPRRVQAAEPLEQAVLVEVNALRAVHGLAPLRLSTRLAAAADLHARSMLAGGFFGHDSADGSPFWHRLKRFYGPDGYGYWSVGENLLWASPGVDAGRALRMWLASPSHRRNLLAPRWREIGLAAVHTTRAAGAFKGLEVTVVAANFGVRR